MKNKLQTHKDYQERINRAMIYIQDHMDETINLDTLAEVSCFSVYHFHRIFTAYTGESVHSYLRRLRIQFAASKLVYSSHNITDIAYAAGFETSASFSKAFKSIIGLSPREFRKRGSIPNYEKPYDMQNNFSGEPKMNPTIKNIDAQEVIFIRKTGSYFTAAPDAWKSIKAYALDNNFSDENKRYIGIAHDDPAITSEQHWRFDACIAGIENPKADGEIGVQTIAGGKYAVFEHVGPYHTLGDTYRKIYAQWWPESGYQLREQPAFIHYVDRKLSKDYGEMTDAERAKVVSHIYVPIE